MAKAKYWTKRLEAIAHSQYNKQEKRTIRFLNVYKEGYQELQAYINELYRKHGESGALSNTEMYKFNRMNDLQKNIKDIVKKIGKDEDKFLGKSMYDNYKEVHKETAEQVAKGANLKLDWSIVPEKQIEKAIMQNWSGKMFSDRIWENKAKLTKQLNKVIANGIATGKTNDDMAKEIMGRMGVGAYDARRLIRTENMFIINEAQKDTYKAAGVRQVEWLTAEDEIVCEECGPMDGQLFDIGKEPGCPLHPNCRCTLLPVIESIR